MTAPTLSLTESQTLTALGTFLTTIMPAGVAIVVGQDNRVPAPSVSDYLTMTPIMPTRLATNEVTYYDGFFDNPATPGTRSDLMRQTVTVQVDVHGPGAADNTATIMTLFRSGYGADQFATYGVDVTPLYTSNPRQLPFLNESNQIEKRYSIDLVLQCNPVLTVPQAFFGTSQVSLVPVAAVYPPGKRVLSILGSQIVYTATGAVAKLRGYSWGLWGTAENIDGPANASQGATHVRILLRWWGSDYDEGVDSFDPTQPLTACIDAAHLAQLDAMMQWAQGAGLIINLAVDSDNGQGVNGYADNFWSDLQKRAQFIAVWQFLAARYASLSCWGMAEILPEPDPAGFSVKDINAFYVEVIEALRPIVPGMLYLVGGQSYHSETIGSALIPGAPDVIYTCDGFMPTGDTQPNNEAAWLSKLTTLQTFASTNNVPVFMQQVGIEMSNDPSLTYTNYMLAAANADEIGWDWWMYRGTNSGGFGPFYPGGENTALLTTISGYLAAS